jgi:starch synthase
MAQSTRILFVGGEVVPFSDDSTIATLMRALPDHLSNEGGFDARLMMPCYGNIDERKHSLHEVIRLSGTDVPMGDITETLTVKVASIPDTRLQVYFMDHEDHFGRNGVAHDGNGDTFTDNARRALFFNRAVLETLRTLRWGPDVIHAFGWIGGLLPLLLSTTFAEDDVLKNTKVVYTPDGQDLGTTLPESLIQSAELAVDDETATLTDIGFQHANASIYPHGITPTDGAAQFSENADERGQQALGLYDQMLNEVPA